MFSCVWVEGNEFDVGGCACSGYNDHLHTHTHSCINSDFCVSFFVFSVVDDTEPQHSGNRTKCRPIPTGQP